MICTRMNYWSFNITSIEIKTETKPVLDEFLLTICLLNDFHPLVLLFYNLCLKVFWLNHLLIGYNLNFLIFLYLFLMTNLTLLVNIGLFFLLGNFVDVDAYIIALSALSLKEILANFLLILIVLLHQVHVSVVLATRRLKVALPHLI